MKVKRSRVGGVNVLLLMVGVSALVVGILVAMLIWGRPSAEEASDGLTVFCAAGMRVPMEQIAQEFEKEYGVHVDLQLGGSNSLLNQIQVNKFDTSDLYLAGDDFYTEKARELGLAREQLPIAHMRPVIAVAKGNPKNIQGIEDLLRKDVAVVIARPEDAAVGRAVKKFLDKTQRGEGTLWTELEAHVTKSGVFKPTVSDVANDIKIGAVDAGIIWDSTVAMPNFRDALEAVPAAELDADPNLVTLCVLNSSKQPTAALAFARYVTARDRGLPVFEEYGFRPVEGDVWAERPQINFYCGAVNRRSVEGLIAEFSEREGVDVNTIYDGCGILTSRMKTIDAQNPALGFPDIYMACDVYYLENVKQWFEDAVNVSEAEIVIAVPKGSDKVKGLEDLIKPGVRVAVGEPEQCTIGALTRRILAHEDLYEKLKEKQKQDGEVVVEKSSSALLVPDVVAGHVDATIAYITDVRANLDDVDIVRIDSPLNLAVQPLSIATTSENKYLVRRLYKHVLSKPEAYQRAGFKYRADRNSADESEGKGS